MNRKITNSKAVFQALRSNLTLPDADEIQAIALAIMEKYYSLTLTDILAEKEIEETNFSKIIQRLNQHEPLQYVFGEAGFYDRKFKVTPAVLIPRPETEMLIQEVLNENLYSPRILDIGTGSGCIAVTLKLEIPQAHICAIDISDHALTIARENAKALSAHVEFIQADFLNEFSIAPVDIIVSNPPYVRESEKKTMNLNVLNYEPHLALFVPDQDPLLFHKAIAEKSKSLLKPGGKVFAEINEHLGKEVVDLFESYGFTQIKIIKDLDGKDRHVRASLIK